MAEINKAQKRRSSGNKGKYTAQYGITYNNKVKAAVAAAIKNLAPAQVSVAPTMKSDWNEIEVTAPVDSMGRPSGTMKLRKVK